VRFRRQRPQGSGHDRGGSRLLPPALTIGARLSFGTRWHGRRIAGSSGSSLFQCHAPVTCGYAALWSTFDAALADVTSRDRSLAVRRHGRAGRGKDSDHDRHRWQLAWHFHP
jgi:hypothetical protein